MTNKLMMAAAGTGVALAMASPASAKTGTVELAMSNYARVNAGADAAAREAALREYLKRHAANGDCGECDDCGGCDKGDCPHCVDCKDEKIACDDCEDAAEPAEGAECDPASHQTPGGAANA